MERNEGLMIMEEGVDFNRDAVKAAVEAVLGQINWNERVVGPDETVAATVNDAKGRIGELAVVVGVGGEKHEARVRAIGRGGLHSPKNSVSPAPIEDVDRFDASNTLFLELSGNEGGKKLAETVKRRRRIQEYLNNSSEPVKGFMNLCLNLIEKTLSVLGRIDDLDGLDVDQMDMSTESREGLEELRDYLRNTLANYPNLYLDDVAHFINNKLSFVVTNLNLFIDDYPLCDENINQAVNDNYKLLSAFAQEWVPAFRRLVSKLEAGEDPQQSD